MASKSNAPKLVIHFFVALIACKVVGMIALDVNPTINNLLTEVQSWVFALGMAVIFTVARAYYLRKE